MPAGRAAAEELVPVPVDVPAEPAVLPAEPDGAEPAVAPLAALPVVELPAPIDLSLMVLLLTSQHLLGSRVLEPVPVCATAKPTPAMVAAAARMAIVFIDVSLSCLEDRRRCRLTFKSGCSAAVSRQDQS